MWTAATLVTVAKHTLVMLSLGACAAFAWAGYEVYRWDQYETSSLNIGTPAPEPYLTRVSSAARPSTDAPEIFPGTPHSRNGLLPIERLDSSTACGQSGCHPDITRQWQQSMHHVASFNNPLYRSSVDYTRARMGDEGARWCAGCHDPVLLLSGTMDGPVTPETPGAQAGVTCLVCHTTIGVQDLTGGGRYILDVPDVTSLREDHPISPLVKFLLNQNPAPHKAGLSNALLHQSELCASCHRVGLTPAQNHFRWLRGQDQYGTWTNGGASGRVARSFYTPEKGQRCQDCHMPLVPSQDAGNDAGFVRSHAFPGANTAIPALRGDHEQVARSTQMLRGSVRVDLFGMRLESTEQGEERWLWPLEQQALPAGQKVTLDVVVRNLKVGHNFPEGVLDNKDVWLEVEVHNAQGQRLWRSGGLDEEGHVLPESHRYGARLLDAAAQLIDKRNIGDFRVPLFSRTLGTGQSEVVPYQLDVPNRVGERLTVVARLRYRKATQAYVNWTFAGQREPNSPWPPLNSPVDEGRYWINDTPVPVLPVVDISEVRVELPVLALKDIQTYAETYVQKDLQTDTLTSASSSTPPTLSRTQGDALAAPLALRLNDYGNSWLRYADLNRSFRAFSTLAERWEQLPEGPVGLARVALRAGDVPRAQQVLSEARLRVEALQQKDPQKHAWIRHARIPGLWAQGLLKKGDYDEAVKVLEPLVKDFPQDRSLWYELGLSYFQQGKLEPAIQALLQTLALDPDDRSAHQLLARAYQEQGKTEQAAVHAQVFEALREEPSVQGLRQQFLQQNPPWQLEAQEKHDHKLQPEVQPVASRP